MAENTNNPKGEWNYDVEWRGDQDHDGKRNFPVIVLGWLSYDIIRNCLRSINLLEGVNPQIYFVENKSKNSDKIKELILNTENIKGYIQYKENFAANVWKVTLEHFLPQINEEFVTITDGDYIFDVDAIDTQYALFGKHNNVGVTSQKRSMLSIRSALINPQDMENSITARETRENQDTTIPFLKRGTYNGMILTTARKTDWQKFIDCINRRDILMSTLELDDARTGDYRPPLFVNEDLYRFFEIVMEKQSLIVQAFPAYCLTDEHIMDPSSEHSIEARNRDYSKVSRDSYQENFEHFHNSHYPSGELKFDIIL